MEGEAGSYACWREGFSGSEKIVSSLGRMECTCGRGKLL